MPLARTGYRGTRFANRRYGKRKTGATLKIVSICGLLPADRTVAGIVLDPFEGDLTMSVFSTFMEFDAAPYRWLNAQGTPQTHEIPIYATVDACIALVPPDSTARIVRQGVGDWYSPVTNLLARLSCLVGSCFSQEGIAIIRGKRTAISRRVRYGQTGSVVCCFVSKTTALQPSIANGDVQGQVAITVDNAIQRMPGIEALSPLNRQNAVNTLRINGNGGVIGPPLAVYYSGTIVYALARVSRG